MRRLICVLVALLLTGTAGAECWTFRYDEPPDALRETSMRVADESVTITLTFAGDCTLGADVGGRTGRNAFPTLIEREGYAYPLRNLRSLFESDDLTIVNLEGVLSGSESGRVKKEYNFRGNPAYTAILTEGRVECANLANNHARDYGARGRADTIAALNAAGLHYFDSEYVTVLEKNGVRVGLTGSAFSTDRKRYLAQVEALQAVGCTAIVHGMHIGREYADELTSSQLSLASYCASHGASLIVGCHPHVVQGVRTVEGVPVLFSLGNCVFGGNTDPKDYDATLLRAELTFASGALYSTRLTLLPIRVSGSERRNDFQPALLSGADAARVLEKMQKTSDFPLSPYLEEVGAVQPEWIYEGGQNDGTKSIDGEASPSGL